MPDDSPTQPPKAVREHIMQHYEDHAETYALVWDQLRQVRQKWNAAYREGRVALLKLSYVNSVISIQTPLGVHEEALNALMAGASIEEALSSVNYNNQKAKYMKETLADTELWHHTVDLLDAGKIDQAHKYALDNMKYVGTVKVPFTLANLGFTRKMCLDANVIRLLQMDEPTTVDVGKYEGICGEVRDLFPELAFLEPYELQWLLFDYQRFYRANMEDEGTSARHRSETAIARHESWFQNALADMERIKGHMDRITPAAEA